MFKQILTGTILFFAVLLALPAPGQAAPTPAEKFDVENVPHVHLTDSTRYVSNPDGIITPDDEAAINQIALQLEQETGVQIAVVALNSVGDNDARMFATKLFNYWGIGQKEEDNGLLIMLVLDPAQRQVIFETGYGLEAVMPDAMAYRIQQQSMIPYLVEGEYSQGMLSGMSAVAGHLRESGYKSGVPWTPPQNSYSPSNYHQRGYDILEGLQLGFFAFIFVGMFLFMGIKTFLYFRPRICPQCNQRTLRRGKLNVIVAPTYTKSGRGIEDWRCTNCGYFEQKERRLPVKSKSSSRSGGSGGGSRSSGGGGFGGGRSGGGGASSRF